MPGVDEDALNGINGVVDAATSQSAAPRKFRFLGSSCSNITSWNEALANHFEIEYGRVGKFVLTGERFVRAAPTLEEIQQQFPDVHGNAQLNAILATANAEHFKKIKNDEEKYAEMFGLIQQVISVDGMDKVKADAAYAAARDNDDPLALLVIVRRVHSLQVGHMTQAQAVWAAQRRYTTLR